MAGHSKWKNIQHRKGRQDTKRGQLFNKISRQLYVAAREGDKDPDGNQQLRAAIAKARSYNMPQENIDRAIQKACRGTEGDSFYEISYEGYGPGGAAVLVDCLTDNRNRTAADLRLIFSKNGGNLGEAGCVSWMFSWKGLIIVDQGSMKDAERMLEDLSADVEEIELRDGMYELVTLPNRMSSVEEYLRDKGITVQYAVVTMLTPHRLEVDVDTGRALDVLLETLEDHDDVQNVHTNADIPQGIGTS
ncbi:YebC/PmpR family DNA-binding transcriptional regulator [Pasteuria penetrans]|uniref:YebC/PmpR family DNA-binding transcriptional regulator n=1 Tax=Pasteuria penetrans TaxID=86005 RepID=UPI000FBD6987|nr:YebC/PmpR family DNA-binding transcriptional regulator [Pasteuria penetrans]